MSTIKIAFAAECEPRRRYSLLACVDVWVWVRVCAAVYSLLLTAGVCGCVSVSASLCRCLLTVTHCWRVWMCECECESVPLSTHCYSLLACVDVWVWVRVCAAVYSLLLTAGVCACVSVSASLCRCLLTVTHCWRVWMCEWVRVCAAVYLLLSCADDDEVCFGHHVLVDGWPEHVVLEGGYALTGGEGWEEGWRVGVRQLSVRVLRRVVVLTRLLQPTTTPRRNTASDNTPLCNTASDNTLANFFMKTFSWISSQILSWFSRDSQNICKFFPVNFVQSKSFNIYNFLFK